MLCFILVAKLLLQPPLPPHEEQTVSITKTISSASVLTSQRIQCLSTPLVTVATRFVLIAIDEGQFLSTNPNTVHCFNYYQFLSLTTRPEWMAGLSSTVFECRLWSITADCWLFPLHYRSGCDSFTHFSPTHTHTESITYREISKELWYCWRYKFFSELFFPCCTENWREQMNVLERCSVTFATVLQFIVSSDRIFKEHCEVRDLENMWKLYCVSAAMVKCPSVSVQM